MNYKSWPDEDLRRVLLTDPDDTLAVCEAAERFAQGTKPTDEELEDARKEGYDEGFNEGYDEGQADASADAE